MPDLQIIRQLANDVGADTALKLMGIFNDDAQSRIAAIRRYLDGEGTVRDLRLHAHSLKGLCNTYGAPKGGDVALALQDACDAGDEDDIAAKARTALDVIPGEITATIEAARELAHELAQS